MKLPFGLWRSKQVYISLLLGFLLLFGIVLIMSDISLDMDDSLPSSGNQTSSSCSTFGISDGEIHIDFDNETICICDSGILICNPDNIVEIANSELEKYYENIDYSCTSDSDCAIKDIHNCCGYFPSCVNKVSQTNPEKVEVLCELSDSGAVCGFPSINSCVCNNGVCEGTI